MTAIGRKQTVDLADSWLNEWPLSGKVDSRNSYENRQESIMSGPLK